MQNPLDAFQFYILELLLLASATLTHFFLFPPLWLYLFSFLLPAPLESVYYQILSLAKSSQFAYFSYISSFSLIGFNPTAKVQFSSVQSLSRVQLFMTPWTTACQASLSITNTQSILNSCPRSWWCHPNISSSVVPFCSRLQSFPASGSFPMSQLFASGGQSIGVSASISVFPMTMQEWFPIGWTGWISLQSKGLSRVFNTTVQKHQFSGTQLSL